MAQTQLERMTSGRGFIAALDQSGGSTPGALEAYGIGKERYSSDAEMFDLMHAMRSRIITSPVFTSEHILAVILFEDTMDRLIEGRSSASYLWETKGIVPFLKVDKGLADLADGVQLMNPMPDLVDLLMRASEQPIFGTKMRSVIKSASPTGISMLVDQQFAHAFGIIGAGLAPILEPEVDIHAPDKAASEDLLLAALRTQLDALGPDFKVMLKLTLPTTTGLYADLVHHPSVLRVVALSGGYERDEACRLLARNPGVIASFSRALTQGLSDGMAQDAYDAELAAAIQEIYAACNPT